MYDALIYPIKKIKLQYVPLLIIYFSYGCSVFSNIGLSFFIKENLTLSAEQLIAIGIWLSLPWNIKMVIGQFVDCIPILGSSRKSYVYIAALMMIIGSVLLIGLAGQWPMLLYYLSPNTIYFLSSLFTILGFVIQDVVADALSIEVVNTNNKSSLEVDQELAIVQLLGRLSFGLGVLIVSGLGGWLAEILTYQQLFILTLIIPIISILGVTYIKIKQSSRSKINFTVIIGGILYATVVIFIGISNITYSQEIVFLISLIIIITLLRSICKNIPKQTLIIIFSASLMLFLFRASPQPGPAVQWFMVDTLQFSKNFFGTMSQVGALVSIIFMYLFAKKITSYPIRIVIFWIIIIGFFLDLPLIALSYGLHEWTFEHFGIGAKTIALLNNAIESPFAQLAMIPMLALIAKYAPKNNRATWFALMASLMNLALTAGDLISKYINLGFKVSREIRNEKYDIIVYANYDNLSFLLIVCSLVSLIIPLLGVYFYFKKTQSKSDSKYQAH